MKAIKVWKDGLNIGSIITDDEKTLGWEELTMEEQADLIHALYTWADFFNQHKKK